MPNFHRHVTYKMRNCEQNVKMLKTQFPQLNDLKMPIPTYLSEKTVSCKPWLKLLWKAGKKHIIF